MGNYIIRRTLINIPVILVILTLVFFATSVLPGDFVAQRIAQQNPTGSTAEERDAQIQAIRRDLGVDKPLVQRYLDYVWNTMQGDLGTSFRTRQPALQVFKDGLPYTLQLSLMTLFVALVTSIPIGIISAIKQDSWADYILRVIAILGVAAPSFWVATILLLSVVRWKLWTIDLIGQPLIWEDPWGSIRLYALPALAGGFASGAGVMRLLRSQMLEVLRQDYIRTAWSKGLRERVIIVRHALKNAMIPVLTVIGLTIAGLISGNVVMEYLFSIPGVGGRILGAITQRDVPVVQAFVLVIATFVVFVNLAVDVLYGWLDPRIRYS
ncbi:MAG: ABC transporter permease [Dehalococcoidia bacterium]|nr:ABC transporter permease [Dehalococcoidia bacterium]